MGLWSTSNRGKQPLNVFLCWEWEALNPQEGTGLHCWQLIWNITELISKCLLAAILPVRLTGRTTSCRQIAKTHKRREGSRQGSRLEEVQSGLSLNTKLYCGTEKMPIATNGICSVERGFKLKMFKWWAAILIKTLFIQQLSKHRLKECHSDIIGLQFQDVCLLIPLIISPLAYASVHTWPDLLTKWHNANERCDFR